MTNLIEKSEILFLFEGKYTIPNGDPFTGEQRYDEETKKILVSDVRIKRYVRDFFINEGKTVYVYNDKSQIVEGDKQSGSSARMKQLWEDSKPKDKNKIPEAALDLLKSCIDVRLFGGISTEKEAAVNLTGPVQFALLNPSLNKSDLRIHQNTSVFATSADKSQGAIGTTTVVPYSINQIQGWVNPYSGKQTDLTENDITEMFSAMWHSINNKNTRSKSNQSSVLLIQIVYKDAKDKLYGTDRLISLNSELEEEQIRSMDDYTFDFTKLGEAAKSEKVKEIKFYTEVDKIKETLKEFGDKFKEMKL